MKDTAMRSFTLLILAVWLCAASAPALAQVSTPEAVYREDFESGQAQGWDLEPGWQIIQDNGNYVLAGKGHVWARAPSHSYDDYRLSFRLKLLSGTIHMVYRLNETGRYFIGFNSNGTYLSKQYFPDTFKNNLASSGLKHSPNTVHQIEISGQGGSLQLAVDGKTEWKVTDPDPILEGSFAFETLDDSQAYVDDIVVVLEPTSAYKTAPGTPPATSLAWVRTGGPLGGLGYDVRMRPDNPDAMFVTDAFAGVFASTDGGANWNPSNEGVTVRTGFTGDAIPVFCLTIDPTDPNTVWLGTQNTRGIFKSTDGGKTWVERDKGVKENQGITFRGVAIDPSNSDIVYAAAELSSPIWNNGQPRPGREFDMVGGVVYKSTDGGLSWKEIWRGDNLARYIWIDPRDTNVLYVSTGIFDREAANSDPIKGDPGGEGVLKSTDGGKTWAKINNGLNNLYVGSLFMHPTNPDILIAGTGNNQYYANNGVYLTMDGGASWKNVVSDLNINAVEFAASNPSIAYAGSSDSILRSEDGGVTWRVVSGGGANGWGAPGVRAGFPIDFQVDPRNPDRIFANEYGGGNFLSEDGGKTWMDASRGYTGADVRAIAVDPKEPGRVIAAARSGIFVSYDGGVKWEGLSYPPVASMEWDMIAIDPANSSHLVAETNWDNILVTSSNGGYDWEKAYNFSGQRVAWRAVAFALSDPQVIYAGSAGYYSAGSFDTSQPGNGIYASRDGGKTWSAANDALSRDAHVASLAIDPQDPNIVYAATANHGLLKTVDGGQNWQTVGGGLPGDSASAITIHPSDPNTLFAGFDRKSLYLSTDGGATWKRSTSGLIPEAKVSSIVFDPVDPGNTLYLADTSSGVYRSTNGGKNWAVMNNGLTTRAISALAISSDGKHLYAASGGGGVFRLDLNGQPPAAASAPAPVPTAISQQQPTSTPVMPGMSQLEPTSAPAANPTEGAALPVSKPGGLSCTGALLLPLAFACLAWGLRRKN